MQKKQYICRLFHSCARLCVRKTKHNETCYKHFLLVNQKRQGWKTVRFLRSVRSLRTLRSVGTKDDVQSSEYQVQSTEYKVHFF